MEFSNQELKDLLQECFNIAECERYGMNERYTVLQHTEEEAIKYKHTEYYLQRVVDQIAIICKEALDEQFKE